MAPNGPMSQIQATAKAMKPMMAEASNTYAEA
jgi:hypothetical protein